jgi:hypothetical protein
LDIVGVWRLEDRGTLEAKKREVAGPEASMPDHTVLNVRLIRSRCETVLNMPN